MTLPAILIVEDESIVAVDLATKLERLGYTVAGIADRGEKAVEMARTTNPQLVLMDIQLHGEMDGIATAEAIRAFLDIPVVYLTAHSDAATLKRAKLSGPLGYILKPFDERDLPIQIELALYKHRTDKHLRQSAAALKQSNDDLEQFAHVASHDLQEPLRAIIGFLGLLQEREKNRLDQKSQMFVDRSVAAAHRMRRMIEDLLTLSRVATVGAEFEYTDLNIVVQSVIDDLQTMIRQKQATVSYGELPALAVDASQMHRLFQNLMINALKYNESPHPQVRIDGRKQGDVYRFSIIDNGIGIEPAFHERIFTVFQRLHTEVEYPGTGLGLALCKKIVERHGGCIWVESRPGEGASFCFTLPQRDRLPVQDDAKG